MTADPFSPVTMLGLGAMGSVLAETLLAAGHHVTVWNRTAGRADALVAAGASSTRSPATRSSSPACSTPNRCTRRSIR